MSTVISVENISKVYRLGQIGGGTLQEDFARLYARFRGKPDPTLKIGQESHARIMGKQFWALEDVNFKVEQGDVLGIIGSNGAGKSTLLKILAQVTTPTSGEIKIKGRIASLLEVGTGFHPDLTGRENVFLNGAILGMSKTEIRNKFDEIVAFSEIEEFIDTPVKRYSSGMYVRLAFAVAAHLEPEILICDEVLAVGDSEFQKKCIGKMQDVSKRGRTVLFVSHSMAAITKLCQKCALLKGGKLLRFGPTDEVIPHYLNASRKDDGVRIWNNRENTSDSRVKLRAMRILSPGGDISSNIDIRRQFSIEVEYEISKPVSPFRIALRFLVPDGTVAFTTSESADPSFEKKPYLPGIYTATCFVQANLLNEGFYELQVSADIPFEEILFNEERALGFSVVQTGGVSSKFPEKWPGVVCPQLKWETQTLKTSSEAALQL